jgi:hypothetical protein
MKYLLITIAAIVLMGCGFGVNKPLVVSVDTVAGAKAPDTSIYEAANQGNIEAVKQHLAAGVNVNVKDSVGETPLHSAAIKGRKEVVKLLIAKGADLNAKDKDGETPLDWAIIGKIGLVESARIDDRNETANLLRKHGGKTGEELKTAGN